MKIKVLIAAIVLSPLLLVGQSSDSVYTGPNPLREDGFCRRIYHYTYFNEEGNVIATGKKKIFFEVKGCLGMWPERKDHGKWKYYDNEGKLISIVWFRKDEVVREKVFE